MTAVEAPPEETVIHVLWINAGLSCDGDSVALTAATQPSIEEIALGALPGLPKTPRNLSQTFRRLADALSVLAFHASFNVVIACSVSPRVSRRLPISFTVFSAA